VIISEASLHEPSPTHPLAHFTRNGLKDGKKMKIVGRRIEIKNNPYSSPH